MQKNIFLATFLFWGLLISSVAQPLQSSQVATSQGGKEAVCDGALEIIPSGQMSFVRKRYTPPVKKNAPKNTKRAKR